MKKAFKVSALLLLVILVVTAFAMPASAKQVFTDLSPEHWCYSKIMDFEKKGYVCGYSDDTFRADRTITRAEYVKIVNNFFGYKPSEKTTSNFKDVNSGDWFMPYVNEAADRGYIEGFEDGTFRPQDPIRRQEATVILARILKIDKEVYPADHKDGLAQYSDSDEVQDWARVAIHSYSVYNFINGYEDGTLRILRNVTRAETVELLHILEQKVIIDRKPGGGTKTPTLKPDIDVLNQNMIEIKIENELVLKEEYMPAKFTNSGWLNKKNSSESKEISRDGAYVNITSQTTDSTIHDTVDEISRKEEYTTTKRDEYDNKFFLADGVYTVTAKATKSGRKDSTVAERKIKIDTVAPVVHGVASNEKEKVAHEQSITVSVKDPNLYKTNEISGLDKAAYAWFNADTEERVTSWVALSLVNGQAKVEAPVAYGRYKLGIAAIDVAENAFGTRTEFNVKAEDISGDVPTNPSGDVDYDFVKETESGDKDSDKNPTGDDIIVVVGNNAPTIEDLILYTSVNKLVSGELVGRDIDSGDVLSYELKDAPNYGTASVTGNETTYVSDKTGTYTYTVRVKDNHSGEATGNVTVYVYDVEVEIPENPSGDEIKYPDLSSEKLIVFTGEEKDMTVAVAPSGEPIKDIEYTWSFKANEEKAEISSRADKENVTVKGLIPGETEITVKVKVNIEKSNGEIETAEIEKVITVVVLSRITIQIPSDSKTYDGTPLEAKNFEVVSGDAALIKGVMASEDTMSVIVSGERVDVGSSDAVSESYTILNKAGEDVAKYYVSTFEKGTLTITASTNEIVITANSDSKKYDGTALKNNGYTYTSGVLVSGDVLEAVVSGEQLNAGSGDNKVISYKVTRNGVDVTDNYTFGESVDGVLEVTTRKVTLTSASASKVYDGTPLTNNKITVSGDGFVSGEGVVCTVTGRQIFVGSGENTFSYKLNDGTLAGNYEITAKTGTLEVTQVTKEVIVTVKGKSASGDKYDGEEKSVTGYEVDISNALYTSANVSYSGEAIAKGTNAGTYMMGLKAENFKNTNKNFANVKFVLEKDGKLEIAQREVTLTSASDTKVYDGTALKNSTVTVTGDGFAKGEGATYDVTGSQTEVGSGENSFDYKLKNGTLVGNYVITKDFGTLTVTACEDEITVTITGNTAEYKYDGQTKKVSGYKVSINNKLYKESDFEFNGTSEVSAKDASGENYYMNLSETDFENKNNNFTNVTFKVTDGYLKINKRNVTLTSASDKKEYDGTALKNSTVTVTGDGFASGEGATYNVTGTITNVGSVVNSFDYTLNGALEDNYNITKVEGKLEVTAKKVSYKVEYYKENLSEEYVLADTETKYATIGSGDKKAEYNQNKYTDGFEFEKVEPVDLTIPASGELVVKVYFARKSYTLTLIAAENVKEVTDGTTTSGEIVLTVKYGEKVNIDAILEDVEGYDVTFDKWQDLNGKKMSSIQNTTITMPANVLTLTAMAKKEEKLPNVSISITSDYPNNGKEAEPGDTISYDAEIKNNESYDINVKIDIDSDSEFADTIEKITIYDKNGKEVGTAEIGGKITIPAGGTVKITYKSDVSTTHPINKDFNSTVKVSTETGKKISSKTVSNDIEKSVGVFDVTNKDKNVILILDLSDSMNDNTKDGKTTKIKALRTATQQFVDKLYNSSKETNTKVTLNVIGIGEAHDVYYGVWPFGYSYDSPSKKNNNDEPILVDSRYGGVDAYLIDSYINANANTWIKSSFISNSLNADGGTNIVGALKLANGIMYGTYTSKNGISNFITNADNYVVILTDGANGPRANKPISEDTDGLKYSKSLRESGAGIYAVYFEGNNADENKIGKADLNTILNNEYPLYEASSADSLNMAFDSIASSISKNQSKEGKITATLPEDGKYFPIRVTYKEKGTEKELFVVNNLAELAARKMTIKDNKLTWDLTGSTYSKYEELKLKLTLDNTATDGQIAQDTLELRLSEGGEKVEIVPVEEITNITSGDTDKDEKITSGNKKLSKENDVVSGDNSIKEDAKSSETASGDNKVLDNKDIKLDNKDENIAVKDEEKEIDNENKAQEETNINKEESNSNKEKQEIEDEEENKQEENEPKLEEKNNEEVIIEEKKEPIIIEEKKNDDDSNDTSDSDEEIK